MPLITLHGEYAARALEESNVTTLLSSAAHTITRESDGTFSVATDDDVVSADAVIVATPPRVAAALGALDVGLATDLGTSPIVNIQFVFDRKVTELAMAACVDSPIEFVFDRSDAAGTQSGQCLVVSLSAADSYMAVGSSELIPRFREALNDLFPVARDAHVLSAVVTREASATFRAAPGDRVAASVDRLDGDRRLPRWRLVRHRLARDDGRGRAQRLRSRVTSPESFFRVDVAKDP